MDCNRNFKLVKRRGGAGGRVTDKRGGGKEHLTSS